ncbi:MAG: putative phosphomannomutase [Parcubacteria group bacterium GW2011_GWA2_47_8]|nr:MAG: putative phosphomannomutase [Parcubacteria group bacterium GW2011_GWA2_47_8]
MPLELDVFRGYDIRGLYPSQINEDLAVKLGHALSMYLGNKGPVVVGRDGRTSSPSLHQALLQGLTKSGIDVIDIGVCTTPMTSYALYYLGAPCGVMISASHNPPEYNAFKLFRRITGVISGVQQLSAADGLSEIKNMVENYAFKPAAQPGKVILNDIMTDYREELITHAGTIKGLQVVADYGNGVGAISADPLLKSLPISYTALYPESDGNFPHHIPDNHNEDNFKDLITAVKRDGADVGLFFDGDADRCIAVDETGQIVSPEIMTGIYALDFLANRGKEKSDADIEPIIYHDLRFSRAVIEEIKAAGGITKKLPVGNTYYKDALIKHGGFFRKYYKPFEISMTLARPLSSETLKQSLQKTFSDGSLSFIDGVSVDYPDWWFNLRLSNTTPVLRLTIEGPDKAFVDEKIEYIKTLISKYIGPS